MADEQIQRLIHSQKGCVTFNTFVFMTVHFYYSTLTAGSVSITENSILKIIKMHTHGNSMTLAVINDI